MKKSEKHQKNSCETALPETLLFGRSHNRLQFDRFKIPLDDSFFEILIQWNLDLRKLDLRKNLDLRKIVGTTDFLVHKLFDLRKIFKA